MHFYNQYKDLFLEVVNSNVILPYINPQVTGNIPQQRQRLRIDNQLFIDKPYVPAYSKEYQLSSKLRQLNRDYSEFESQVKELEQLGDIQKMSQSRRKQTKKGANMVKHHAGEGGVDRGNTSASNMRIVNAQQPLHSSNQKYTNLIKPKRPHPQQSTIFDHYNDTTTNTNDLEYRIGTNHLVQQKRKLKNNDIRQGVKKQNDVNVRGSGVQQQLNNSNNIVNQSQISDVFNWKIQQSSPKVHHSPTINPPSSSNHKLNTPLHQHTFGVRNTIQNSNISAMQRRRIAKERINDRRQKLKQLLKSKY